jgi:hypothetical protein
MGLDNPLHIAFLLILVLLVFGAKRLPELAARSAPACVDSATPSAVTPALHSPAPSRARPHPRP